MKLRTTMISTMTNTMTNAMTGTVAVTRLRGRGQEQGGQKRRRSLGQ